MTADDIDDDEFLFDDEDKPGSPTGESELSPSTSTQISDQRGVRAAAHPAAQASNDPWYILVVDDDEEVHSVTRMLLHGFTFKGREVNLLSANSGRDAMAIMAERSDVAVILLDVVMETDDAGLRVVRDIRENIGNREVRIILRTGQPGQAPERDIIVGYDINDYKAKTELTAQKLFTTVVAALRSYDDIMALTQSRKGLEKILAASSSLFRQQSMQLFATGVLTQLNALVGAARDGILCVGMRGEPSDSSAPVDPEAGDAVLTIGGDGPAVLAASGRYEPLVGHPLDRIPDETVRTLLSQALTEARSLYGREGSAIYLRTTDGRDTAIFLHTDRPLSQLDQDLMQTFCENISVGFENLARMEALRAENKTLKQELESLQALKT